MKKFITAFFLIAVTVQYAQDKESSILGQWIFQSMTTITKAQREEITIVYKDEKNVETLTFDKSGEIAYHVTNNGIKKTGRGVWYPDDSYVTIIIESDTTYGALQIEDGSLTIITSEEESDEFYGYSTILKYSR
ncbi:MAG: hypothetical protein ACJZ2B_07405 [Candidatus Neomarinimicrobiota bacterium]|tara:strand:+ start:14271 stop:14672 length:402 start_codon:yes stop_codon:yes gene_type:complete